MTVVSEGHRRTQQKAAIRAALSQSTDFVSAQDLHSRMRDAGLPIGLATVYRNLNEMAKNGEADVLQAANAGGNLFRSCGESHHHHLYCVNCGKTIEVDAPVEGWVDAVAAEHGFTGVRHVVDIFGLCPACQAVNADRGARRS